MRILSGRDSFPDRPFEGQGVSVYAGIGQARYRRPRVVSGRLTPLRTAFTGEKTARIASEAATAGDVEVEATVPAEILGNPAAAIDARHYRDDVENEVSGPVLMSIDSGGDEDNLIEGRAILVEAEIRTGGDVRFHWRYEHGRGTPARFRWARLSGPSSPAAVTVAYLGPGLYEADFTSLSSGTYTFRLTIEDTAGTTTTTLLTPVSVTPDATGPNAPTNLSVEVR